MTWMVRNDLLEIKVAIRTSGIFHPKIGILTDLQDNRIAFNGSANESIHGWDFNYEYLDVFCSWDEPRRVADKEEQFRQLWEGRSRGAIVIPIPDDYQEYLKQVAPPRRTRRNSSRHRFHPRMRETCSGPASRMPSPTIRQPPPRRWPLSSGLTRRTSGSREQQGQAPTGFSSRTRWGWARRFRPEYCSRPASTRSKVDRLLILTPQERPPAVATGAPAQVQYRRAHPRTRRQPDGPHPAGWLGGTGARPSHGTHPTA